LTPLLPRLTPYNVRHAADIAAQEASHIVLDGWQRALGIHIAEAAEVRGDDDVLRGP
jgi:hypothetical protein